MKVYLSLQYLDLLRAVCSLLDMELPKQKVKIAHLPQKERDKMTKERHCVSCIICYCVDTKL